MDSLSLDLDRKALKASGPNMPTAAHKLLMLDTDCTKLRWLSVHNNSELSLDLLQRIADITANSTLH
jgi:hypothetical protein